MIKLRNLFVLLLLTVLSSLYFSSIVYATENDTVSTEAEMVQWMEAHKNTGGTVNLDADITLRDMWYYIPDRPGMSLVTVNMNEFHITIAGEISFHSDNHLVFRGAADETGMFRVVPGGQLYLHGLSVEDKASDGAEEEGYALVQEEGAGLIVEECQVAGRTNYAETLFVIDNSPMTVVAEPGQAAADVLPTVIEGKVNRKGKVSYEKEIPVSWKLTGTEKRQQERMRFTVQGVFSGAASIVPPTCTVVYNDFPLTFTDVDASATSSAFLFKGGFTKPKKHIPMLLAWEYSFDNKNWIEFEADYLSPSDYGFFISIDKDEWDISVYPYVYIRLHGSHNGTEYYSDVLRYTNDLKQEEPLGGGRGGGTSIVRPPETPVPVPKSSPVPTETAALPEKSSAPASQDSVPETKPVAVAPVSTPQIPTPRKARKSAAEHGLAAEEQTASHRKNTAANTEKQEVSIKKSSVAAGTGGSRVKAADASHQIAADTRADQSVIAESGSQNTEESMGTDSNQVENQAAVSNAISGDEKHAVHFPWIPVIAGLLLCSAGIVLFTRKKGV